jgi:hypothetical protein
VHVADATRSPVRVEHAPTTFLLKKSKNTKMSPMTLAITQNTHVKVQKYSQMQILSLVFFEVKDVLSLYTYI